jgi:hypothetical protein
MNDDDQPPARAERRAIPHVAPGYAASLPERSVRAVAASVGGAVHETVQLLLPRFVRRSRFYEVTAKNALRIAIELVGGVTPPAPAADAAAGDAADAAAGDAADAAPAPGAGRVAVKKVAGNVVEFGSIAAFGFSPLWLLAGAADILNGSRVYLRALEAELARAGILAEGAHFGSVDQLLGAIEGTSGTTAQLIDLPPLELAELRRSLGELKRDATSLPSPGKMTALFDGLVRTATAEGRSLLEVSSGVGLAFLTSARAVGREHLVAPYREDWRPLRSEGFAAYAARVAGPYRAAISGHFDPERKTFTERAPGTVRNLAAKARRRLGRRPRD